MTLFGKKQVSFQRSIFLTRLLHPNLLKCFNPSSSSSKMFFEIGICFVRWLSVQLPVTSLRHLSTERSASEPSIEASRHFKDTASSSEHPPLFLEEEQKNRHKSMAETIIKSLHNVLKLEGKFNVMK